MIVTLRKSDLLLVVLIALLAWRVTGGELPTPGPSEGKRTVLVVREASESTPEQARMIVALRTGAHAEYLKSKGHVIYVLDDDSVDKDGNPSPVVQAWKAELAGLTMPVVLVIDTAGNNLIHKQSLAATATADDVMALLKAHGG